MKRGKGWEHLELHGFLSLMEETTRSDSKDVDWVDYNSEVLLARLALTILLWVCRLFRIAP